MEKSLKDFKSLLANRISGASRVFIIPHINVDFDALGASVGVAEICSHLGKSCCIVMNEQTNTMSVGIRGVYETVLKQYTVLAPEQVILGRKDQDIVVMVDVGKKNLIPDAIREQLPTFSRVVILVQTKDKFVNLTTSSTCEMITRLFKMYGMKPNKWMSNLLLAGIFLDTNKLRKNTNEKTLEIAARLIRCGASIQDVNDLFLEDFEHDRAIQHLIDGTEFISHTIHSVAIIVNSQNPDRIYSQAELAQAADYLLQYKVDASYAIGLVGPDTIGISARTMGGMYIADVMHLFNGGGNEHSAAARVLNTSDVELVKRELLKVISREEFYAVKSTILEQEVENLEKDSEAVGENDFHQPQDGTKQIVKMKICTAAGC